MARALKRPILYIGETVLICLVHLANILSHILPARALMAIFTSAGYLIFYCVPPIRRNLISNISSAMPEITDPGEVKRIALGSLASFISPALDVMLFLRQRERFVRELEVQGMEIFDRAEAEGRGMIFLTAHIGSYSLGTPIGPFVGTTFTPIAANPARTPFPRLVRTLFHFGKKMGGDPEVPFFFTDDNTIERSREHLKRGKRLGITVDIPGKGIGDLFGRPVALAEGIAHFAYDTGAAIVPAFLYRDDGIFKRKLVFFEPVTYEPTGDRATDVKTMMPRVTKALEEGVRTAPGQWSGWLALHKWWKRAERLQEVGE